MTDRTRQHETHDGRGTARAEPGGRRRKAPDFQNDFDRFCTEVQSRYAYFDSRPMDWAAACAHFRPSAAAATTRGAFVGVMERTLAQLADAHAHLATSTPHSPRLIPTDTDVQAQWRDGRAHLVAVRAGSAAAQAGVRPGMTVLRINGVPVREATAAWAPRFVRADADAAVRAALQDWALNVALAGLQDRQAVRLQLQSGEAEREVAVRYGVQRPDAPLSVERVGDVHLIRIHNRLGGPALIGAFDAAVDAALREQARALILDLRDVPSGGNSTVARGLMGRLVAQRVPYQMHESVAEQVQTGVRRVWVEQVLPRGTVFAGPVALLVGPWTSSMGEGIAIGLHAARQAPVIGQPMAGLMGAVEEFHLPDSDITVRIPAEKLFHVSGTPRERFRPCAAPAIANEADPERAYALGLLKGRADLPACQPELAGVLR